MKIKKQKDKKETFQLDNDEIALIYKSLKTQEKKFREEMFYRPMHHYDFYRFYIERLNKLLNDFSGKPRVVKKEWRF